MSNVEKNISEILHDIQVHLSVPKNRYNKFGNYNYRNAEDIVDSVKPLLPGGITLVISDEVIVLGDRFYVKATAALGSAKECAKAVGYAREPQEQKGMSESQITGAASSYARKYALNGLFAIDDGVDADSQDNTSSRTKAHSTAKDYVVSAETADQLYNRIVKLLDVNKELPRESFVGWWNSAESKSDRAKLKMLDFSRYQILAELGKEAVAKYGAAA